MKGPSSPDRIRPADQADVDQRGARSSWFDSPARLAVVANGGLVVLLWDVGTLVLAAMGTPFTRALAVSLVAALLWALAVAALVRTAGPDRPVAGGMIPVVVGVALGTAILWAVSHMGRLDVPGRVELLVGLIAAVVAVLWWWLVERLGYNRPRVLVVGAESDCSSVAAVVAEEAPTACDLVGYVDWDAGRARLPVRCGRLEDLASVVRHTKPTLVVLASDARCTEACDAVLDAADAHMPVVDLSGFYERTLGRVPVRRLSAEWFMTVLGERRRRYSPVSKRLFDIAVALGGMAVVAPLLPFIIVLVRTTRGPIVYRQTRVGLEGARFTIYKFRSMNADAEANGAPAWAVERDARVTSAGRVLRRTRLDEIPQLWNVLKGDMSIVGPRPERPEYFGLLTETVPFWATRHLVKPGITGWAQLKCGYASDSESSEHKLAHDLWYVRHRSLSLDLFLCIRTMGRLVTGAGAR